MHNAINRMIENKSFGRGFNIQVKSFLYDNRLYFYVFLLLFCLFICQTVYSTITIATLVRQPIYLFFEMLTLIIAIYIFSTFKKLEESVIQLQHFDSLTGLPNQRLFLKSVNTAIEELTPYDDGLAVYVINLKNFKEINSLIGYDQADELLKEVTDRICSVIQNDDLITRINGAEFGFYHFIKKDAVYEIRSVVQNLLEQIQMPWRTAELDIKFVTNIGIAIYPFDGSDGEHLLRNAELACEQKGLHIHSNFNFFTPSINEEIARRFTMEQKLRAALDNDEFVLYYQPQVDIKLNKVIGLEALVRWQHPELGLVLPTHFIPIAEETGLILPLGSWVLQTACRQNKLWQKAGFSPVRITVNLSALQFNQPSLVSDITRVLLETGLAPQWLELEITESVAMENVQLTLTVLQELQNAGISIALDDFGTGYSSLIYLKKFPILTLKIDRDFIKEVPDNHEDTAIVTAIITLAKQLKLNVVAEGVETLKQIQFFESNGCNRVQGYYYSIPVPVEKVPRLFNNHFEVSFKVS